jgi:8-oxo-dGTP diphosphatase
VQSGKDYIGVGVGAIVSDARNRLFLARRGPAARNEAETWEFPGGLVAYGERLEHAVLREFTEEYGMTIEVTGQLGAFDHILLGEHQHWVSITYLARHTGGEPSIREPRKCSEIGWFTPDALPTPLSVITYANLHRLRSQPS